MSLIGYYNESQMLVINGEECSCLFRTKIGVKQGGAVSPSLFSIYLEELINLIEKNKAGLEIDTNKIDIVAYADDVLLVSSTKEGLQQQLNIVQDYGLNNEIKYNPDKTVFMIFHFKLKRNVAELKEDIWQGNLVLDGTAIKRVDTMKYLGVDISEDDRLSKHLSKRKRLVQQALFKLKIIGLQTPFLHPIMKGQLYKTYIRPILLYGLETFYLKLTDINDLKRFEGNTVKTIMDISTRCRSTYLTHAMNIEPLQYKLRNIKIDFFLRLKENKFTEEILLYLEKQKIRDDLISEIFEITNILQFELGTTIKEASLYTKYVIQDTIRCERDNVQVAKIRNIFESKNRKDIAKSLYEMLKFN
ncbi:unnamed protein product [Brachionus calyciflorus]|uniref:Reverse transcriptase domain-containing protein n=1 Tax=Brachionus calyciflorus TaxID=104777 RepID=A0A813NWJ6_9BILA|nr:unnamed protein product [Brachionus calyciflorus]